MRRIFPQYTILVAVLGLALLLSACGGGGKAVEPPTLSVVAGEIQVGSGGNCQEVTDASQLAADNSVKTGMDGWVLLTYTDGSTVTLAPDTEVSLASGSEDILVNLAKGQVWAASNQSKIQVDAGGPVASAQTTSFGVTKQDGAVKVDAVGGTVKFSADGSEVDIPSGWTSTSSSGTPSAPAAIEVKNALRLNLTGEALIYLVDPQGRAVGHHPTQEISTNQIPDSWYSGKAGRPQVISVPNITAGEYTILLVAAGNQSAWKLDVGLAGSDLNYQNQQMSSSITWGTPTGITMKVTLDDQDVPSAELSPIWTLYTQPPGKVALGEQLKRTKIQTGPEMPAWAK